MRLFSSAGAVISMINRIRFVNRNNYKMTWIFKNMELESIDIIFWKFFQISLLSHSFDKEFFFIWKSSFHAHLTWIRVQSFHSNQKLYHPTNKQTKHNLMWLLCNRLILALLVYGPKNRKTMPTFRSKRSHAQCSLNIKYITIYTPKTNL